MSATNAVKARWTAADFAAVREARGRSFSKLSEVVAELCLAQGAAAARRPARHGIPAHARPRAEADRGPARRRRGRDERCGPSCARPRSPGTWSSASGARRPAWSPTGWPSWTGRGQGHRLAPGRRSGQRAGLSTVVSTRIPEWCRETYPPPCCCRSATSCPVGTGHCSRASGPDEGGMSADGDHGTTSAAPS